MGLFGPQCQSCSMPMKDPAKRGSEADGAMSLEYCGLCYQNGKFLQPDISAVEMKEFVCGKMVEMGVPKVFAMIFSRKVPKLKRWKAV